MGRNGVCIFAGTDLGEIFLLVLTSDSTSGNIFFGCRDLQVQKEGWYSTALIRPSSVSRKMFCI
jgi:hypothetical protein